MIHRNYRNRRGWLWAALAFSAFILLFCGLSAAVAHPEDEFCGPGSTIDPVLCRQLNAALSGTGDMEVLFLDEAGERRPALAVGLSFAQIGVDHILPGGLDHILFIVALFLGATSLRSLVLQISVFTIAHTVTLGLVGAAVISPPASLVEPIIAASITFVATENIYFKDITHWRLPIIFGFGLFHGMGFAGFIREVGLPADQFWSALIGFNIGVEVGQLSIVAAAALLSHLTKKGMTQNEGLYRNYVVVPASTLIALTGLWWAVTRSLGL